MRGFIYTVSPAFSAINASALEVTFNQAINEEDQADATFVATRDGNTVAIAVDGWNEDGNKVTLVRTTGTVFAVGDYVVTIGGLELEEATYEFELEARAETYMEISTEFIRAAAAQDASISSQEDYNEDLHDLHDLFEGEFTATVAVGSTKTYTRTLKFTKGVATVTVPAADAGNNVVLTVNFDQGTSGATTYTAQDTFTIKSAEASTFKVIGQQTYNEVYLELVDTSGNIITSYKGDKVVNVKYVDEYGDPKGVNGVDSEDNIIVAFTNGTATIALDDAIDANDVITVKSGDYTGTLVRPAAYAALAGVTVTIYSDNANSGFAKAGDTITMTHKGTVWGDPQKVYKELN